MKKTPGWKRERRLESQPDLDAGDEIRFHIEGRIAELVETGVPESEARRLVEQRFGDSGKVMKKMVNESKSGRARLIEEFMRDMAISVRRLRTAPGYAASIWATLALSIGAVVAITTVVNGVLLKPLPYPDPEELVHVWEVDERPDSYTLSSSATIPNFYDWKNLNQTMVDLGGYNLTSSIVVGEDGSERVSAGLATGELFNVLAVTPAMGRLITQEDALPGAPNVVVISHSYWQQRLSGDESVLGSSITFGSGNSAEIIGVLPSSFRFLADDVQLWTPRTYSESQLDNRRSHVMRVIGRLRDGVTVAEADEDIKRVASVIRAEHPDWMTGYTARVVGLLDETLGDSKSALFLLLAGAGLLLVVAIVNVTNLMLVRLQGERVLFAVRSALGASRGRLIRQALTESFVTTVVGGVLGLIVASAGLRIMLAMAPEDLPRTEYVALDMNVLGISVLLILLTSLAVGILPSLLESRANLVDTMRVGSRSVAGGSRRLRDAFAVLQTAGSLVLLISGGLLIASFQRTLAVDPGFNPENVLTMDLSFRGSDYPDVPAQAMVTHRISRAVTDLPMVESAGTNRFLPLRDQEWTWGVEIQGKVPVEGRSTAFGVNPVTPGYFDALGMTLLEGRLLDTRDGAEAVPVAVVNDAFVDFMFEDGESAIGQSFAFNRGNPVFHEIVGVVRSVRHSSLQSEVEPRYYLPIDQLPFSFFYGQVRFVVRTQDSPLAAVEAIRNTISDIDPNITVTNIRTMESQVLATVASTRFASALLSVFAVVALVLAAVGLYGVISYSVSQRRKEFCVRMALGETTGSVLRSVLRSAAGLAGAGVLIGLVTAAFATRLQQDMLYGIDAFDPILYGATTLVLLVVALVAGYFPARKAGAVSPSEILRED